jgi:hypothetical protein
MSRCARKNQGRVHRISRRGKPDPRNFKKHFGSKWREHFEAALIMLGYGPRRDSMTPN